MLTSQITQLLNAAVQTLDLPAADFAVERPKDESHGDFSTNIAMVLFGQIDKTIYASPLILAQAIAAQISTNTNPFSITVAHPGFINFTAKNPELISSFNQLFTQPDLIDKRNTGKTAIVEYSSPNIAKPFTVGHLRSTVIGDAIANIKEATGWKVLRDNHLGDWGTQFGKLICAIKKNWIPLEQIESADNPVKLLVELYVQFHQAAETDPSLEDEARLWFKKLEDGDTEARSIWQKCVDWSWKEFDRIYQQLHISFSPELNQGRGLGESFFEDKMQVILDQLETNNLLSTGELGAKVVDFGEKYPPLMILKKDGATLYATRDLATDYYRKQTFDPDTIINEVGAEQTLYFRQIFEIEQQLGWWQPSQRIHVGHGMYRFKDGKMSTRKGNVIWLEEVIEKAVERAKSLVDSNPREHGVENKDELAHHIGIGALKWNDLKGEAKRDIVFDWDEILSMKGNSGPYAQYTYARANSVLSKANAPITQIDSATDLNQEEWRLLRWLLQFTEIVHAADKANDPSLVAIYLYELCQRFNTFYNKHSILGTDQPIPHRLTLTQQTQQTIKTGLNLLGISAPEKM